MENFEFQKEGYLSPEDKWAHEINAREKLWKDTVQKAEISPEVKIRLLDAIDKMPGPRSYEGGIDFWAHDFISYLLNIVGDMPKIESATDDTKVLFESLRDDIYSFVADLKK